MKRIIGILTVALLILGLTVFILELGPGLVRAQTQDASDQAGEELGMDKGQEFPVPLKPLPTDITPCRACHGPEKDFPVNYRRREDLLVHKNVKLNHGGVRVWCLDCHSPDNRNYLLPLSDGKVIGFGESYLLCGKCHGTKFRDWRNGIHGKRTGYWNGTKQYHLCVSCHSPHSPRFKPIEPMAAPRKPWTPKEVPSKRAAH